MAAFYVATVASFMREGVWPWYLDVNADVSGEILRLFGSDITVTGNAITSPQASLVVAVGCDAIHPSALLVAGILAYPARVRKKLLGLVVGTLLLLSINLVRIVSLFYIQIHFPQAFDVMHIEVWQVLFIFLAIVFWALWVRRVEGAARAGRHAPA